MVRRLRHRSFANVARRERLGERVSDRPSKYIDRYVSATLPVIVLDQSAHLAYANLQAFVAAGICASTSDCTVKSARKPLPTPPGRWVADSQGTFTGEILEQQAFPYFNKAAGTPPATQVFERATAFARDFARAGVTTMVNGGTELLPQLNFLSKLAGESRSHPVLRYRTLVPFQAVQPARPTPWDDGDDGFYGVTGIKVWEDGSAQGCTATLADPYDPHGLCGSHGKGEPVDYPPATLVQALAPYWQVGWPMQFHVNGDAAILTVLDILAELQLTTRNRSPITLLHATIDGNPATREDVLQQLADLRDGRRIFRGKPVPPVDVQISHLIGHVAYWGGALEGILDGVTSPTETDEHGRAALIDATKRDTDVGLPFSLHSDAPVSPARPLWYVEQAVTRRTWFYPHLADSDSHAMPGDQKVSVDQALRAINIEAARQHALDRHIGSIEVGKAADLVLLDKNPLHQAPDEIHNIRVLETFVAGHRNVWEPRQGEPRP